MNPGTVSLILLAVFGFGIVGTVAWFEYSYKKAQPRRSLSNEPQ